MREHAAVVLSRCAYPSAIRPPPTMSLPRTRYLGLARWEQHGQWIEVYESVK